MNAVNPFVSYARNFEDAVLWRALKHTSEGFYIDVGAKDPTLDSITRAFYERGWRGINIAATESHHTKLKKHQAEDLNLHAIVCEKSGVLRFTETETSATTLNDLLANHPSDEIHFIKIDLISLSSNVLEDFNFDEFRPWIILIAGSTLIHSENHPPLWEQQLHRQGYLLAHQDTLNHYYVATEHHESLGSALAAPPKVFDEWILREKSQVRTQRKLPPFDESTGSSHSMSANHTPDFWTPAADDFRRADYWIRELIEVNRRHLSSIRDALGKGRKKIKGFRLGKPLQKAKKSLERARRKHFSEMSLKLEDAEPKVSWPKRWLKSWLRPQGSVNKSLFASLNHLLKAHELVEARAQAQEREMGRVMKRLADYEANFPVNAFAHHDHATPQNVPDEVTVPSDLADPDIARLECRVHHLLK